jgi:ubiquitin C-terminal hydrolase
MSQKGSHGLPTPSRTRPRPLSLQNDPNIDDDVLLSLQDGPRLSAEKRQRTLASSNDPNAHYNIFNTTHTLNNTHADINLAQGGLGFDSPPPVEKPLAAKTRHQLETTLLQYGVDSEVRSAAGRPLRNRNKVNYTFDGDPGPVQKRGYYYVYDTGGSGKNEGDEGDLGFEGRIEKIEKNGIKTAEKGLKKQSKKISAKKKGKDEYSDENDNDNDNNNNNNNNNHESFIIPTILTSRQMAMLNNQQNTTQNNTNFPPKNNQNNQNNQNYDHFCSQNNNNNFSHSNSNEYIPQNYSRASRRANLFTLVNIGSSCFINSLLQVLVHLPSFVLNLLLRSTITINPKIVKKFISDAVLPTIVQNQNNYYKFLEQNDQKNDQKNEKNNQNATQLTQTIPNTRYILSSTLHQSNQSQKISQLFSTGPLSIFSKKILNLAIQNPLYTFTIPLTHQTPHSGCTINTNNTPQCGSIPEIVTEDINNDKYVKQSNNPPQIDNPQLPSLPLNFFNFSTTELMDSIATSMSALLPSNPLSNTPSTSQGDVKLAQSRNNSNTTSPSYVPNEEYIQPKRVRGGNKPQLNPMNNLDTGNNPIGEQNIDKIDKGVKSDDKNDKNDKNDQMLTTYDYLTNRTDGYIQAHPSHIYPDDQVLPITPGPIIDELICVRYDYNGDTQQDVHELFSDCLFLNQTSQKKSLETIFTPIIDEITDVITPTRVFKELNIDNSNSNSNTKPPHDLREVNNLNNLTNSKNPQKTNFSLEIKPTETHYGEFGLFCGTKKTTLICSSCQHSRVTAESFSSLTVHVPAQEEKPTKQQKINIENIPIVSETITAVSTTIPVISTAVSPEVQPSQIGDSSKYPSKRRIRGKGAVDTLDEQLLTLSTRSTRRNQRLCDEFQELDQIDQIDQNVKNQQFLKEPITSPSTDTGLTPQVSANNTNISTQGKPQSLTLSNLLGAHFEPVVLEIKCDKCGFNSSVCTPTIAELPEVMVLHAQRWRFANSGGKFRLLKSQRIISIDDKLDLEPYLDGSFGPQNVQNVGDNLAVFQPRNDYTNTAGINSPKVKPATTGTKGSKNKSNVAQKNVQKNNDIKNDVKNGKNDELNQLDFLGFDLSFEAPLTADVTKPSQLVKLYTPSNNQFNTLNFEGEKMTQNSTSNKNDSFFDKKIKFPSSKYTLFAIINHKGSTPSSGHYYTDINLAVVQRNACALNLSSVSFAMQNQPNLQPKIHQQNNSNNPPNIQFPIQTLPNTSPHLPTHDQNDDNISIPDSNTQLTQFSAQNLQKSTQSHQTIPNTLYTTSTQPQIDYSTSKTQQLDEMIQISKSFIVLSRDYLEKSSHNGTNNAILPPQSGQNGQNYQIDGTNLNADGEKNEKSHFCNDFLQNNSNNDTNVVSNCVNPAQKAERAPKTPQNHTPTTTTTTTTTPLDSIIPQISSNSNLYYDPSCLHRLPPHLSRFAHPPLMTTPITALQPPPLSTDNWVRFDDSKATYLPTNNALESSKVTAYMFFFVRDDLLA